MVEEENLDYRNFDLSIEMVELVDEEMPNVLGSNIITSPTDVITSDISALSGSVGLTTAEGLPKKKSRTEAKKKEYWEYCEIIQGDANTFYINTIYVKM